MAGDRGRTTHPTGEHNVPCSSSRPAHPPPPPLPLVWQGLHVRMDLSAGKRYAKKLAPEPTPTVDPPSPPAISAVHAAVGTDGAVTITEGPPAVTNVAAATDAPAGKTGPPPSLPLTAVSSDAAAAANETGVESTEPPADPAAVMQSVLLGLPQPPQELTAALAAGLSGDALHALLERLWAARQAELADAIASMRTEGQTMAALLTGIVNGSLVGQARVTALHDLEFAVSQLHNAEDFAAMGGVAVLTQLLNGTDPTEVAAVAWTLGSALKYAAKVQTAAARHGTAVGLLSAMTRGLSEPPTTAAGGQWQRVTGKALYALAALLRHNPAAQAELRRLGAGHVLLAAVRSVSSHLLDGDVSSSSGQAMVSNLRRVWELLADLHTEAQEAGRASAWLASPLLSHEEATQWCLEADAAAAMLPHKCTARGGGQACEDAEAALTSVVWACATASREAIAVQ